MKHLCAIILTLTCLSLPALAQKQTKEEKQQAKLEEQVRKLEANEKKYAPAEITIHASLDVIRTALIREQLSRGYELRLDSPSQMIFSKYIAQGRGIFLKMIAGPNMRQENKFTFAPQAFLGVVVFGVMDVATPNPFGQSRADVSSGYSTNKGVKKLMQDYLDKLKATIEAH